MSQDSEQRAYDRGAKDGRLEGYEYMLVCCYCKLAEMGLTGDELYKLHMEMRKESENIRRFGKKYYIKRRNELLENYGIRFNWAKDIHEDKPVYPLVRPSLESLLKNMRGEY